MLALTAACKAGPTIIADGEGALQSAPHLETLGKSRDWEGGPTVWSAGGPPLCLADGAQPVELVSIEPNQIVGDVTVQAIGVILAVGQGDQPPGLMPGIWPDLAEVPGYVIEGECDDPDKMAFGVVAVSKDSEAGGALHGLTITYRDRGRLYSYPFGLYVELCGTGPEVKDCVPAPEG